MRGSSEFAKRCQNLAVLAKALVVLSDADWYLWKAFKSHINWEMAAVYERYSLCSSGVSPKKMLDSTVDAVSAILAAF